MIGWSRLGKTVYLQALTLILLQMNRFWRYNYSHIPLTDITLDYVQKVQEFLVSGKMPISTQLKIQDAYIMQLLGMERWGGRTLVVRDVAGEVFDELQFPLHYTPYLLHVPTTFLMISIADILSTPNRSMDHLMSSFISTMRSNDKNFKKSHRKVVLVLSKADLLFDKLPVELQNYLDHDPFSIALKPNKALHSFDAQKMLAYVDELKEISKAIRNWVSAPSNPVGASAMNLISLAKNNNIQIEFAMVSSTGRPVDDGNQMLVDLAPKRVLDPFIWALEFQRDN